MKETLLKLGTIFLFTLFIFGCTDNSINQNENCLDTDTLIEKIQEKFDLKPGTYSIETSECNLVRGGNFSAKIEYKGESLDIYYKWGWCSSGGSDCGWDMCIKSHSLDSDLYGSLKQKYCGKIFSRQFDTDMCEGREAYDYTNLTRSQCLAGDFENINSEESTLSLKYDNDRCTSSVEIGDFNCFKE